MSPKVPSPPSRARSQPQGPQHLQRGTRGEGRAEGCPRGTGSPRGGAAAPALVLALIGKLEPGTLAQAAAYISQLLSLAAGASAPAWKRAWGGPWPPVPGGASAPLRRPPQQSRMGCVARDRFTLIWVFLDPYGSVWVPHVSAVLASLGVVPCAPRDAGAACCWVLLVLGQSEGLEDDCSSSPDLGTKIPLSRSHRLSPAA